MQEWLDYYRIPGICIAIIEYDTINWIKGYGIKDNKTGETVNEETIYSVVINFVEPLCQFKT